LKQHSNKTLQEENESVFFWMKILLKRSGMLLTHRTTDFQEWKEQYYGDGVVQVGTVMRLVYIFAQILVLGSLSETHVMSSNGYGG
jgi:hypothetical protein